MTGRQGRSSDGGAAMSIPASRARVQSSNAGREIRVCGHGAVDREPRGLAHLGEEGGLDRLLARRQHELQLGAVHDVGRDRPADARHGLDAGQADRHREAVEVDVGVVEAEARPAVLEHAEHEPPPALGVERAVEEGAAFELLSPGGGVRRMLEDDRQRIVPGGGADAGADGLGVIGRAERDGGAMRVGRGVVGADFGVGLAEKMLRREVDAPARCGLAVRHARAGRDGATAPREAEHAHTGRVLSRHQVFAPAVLGE